MDLQTLYLIAKSCKEYSDFCTYLGKYVNIPSTDARCLSITLEDLMNKNLEALSESQSVSDNETKKKICHFTGICEYQSNTTVSYCNGDGCAYAK